MKKYLLLLLVLSSSLSTLQAQSWLWARQGRNPDKQSWLTGATSIAMDKFHNVYQTGKYDGDTVIFGSDTLFGQPFETFLVKYDENGNVLWVKSSQTNNNNINVDLASQSVITDSRGNAYITGGFEDTLNFQSIALSAPQKYTLAFLVKYDANGNVKWARQSNTPIQGYAATTGISVTVDKSDNLYMTGRYQNSCSFGTDTLEGTANANTFLVKYDTNGNVIWARQGVNGVFGDAWGESVTTDNMGYIYITGFYIDSITFGTQTLTAPSTYQSNLFIAKYDSRGNVIWAKQPIVPKGNSVSWGNAIGTDKSGNIYVTGYFSDTVIFGTYTLTSLYAQSPQAVFWAKYDNNGNLLWARQTYSSDSLSWQGWSITTDDNFNLYLNVTGAAVGTQMAKIIFNSDTLQSKVKFGTAWLRFDSANKVLNSYIFPAGGGGPQVQTVNDSSGCYVYFGGNVYDSSIVFGSDTVGTNFKTPSTFVARWSDGICITGINTIENPNLTVNLYPNPNDGTFNLEFDSHSELVSESQTIVIYNVLGKKVYSASLKQIQGDNLIQLGNKPSGVYLYRIIDQQSNLLASGKFIIQ